MAVDTAVANRFRKYIPPGEKILATITCEPVFGLKPHRLCVTEGRFAVLERHGLFSWSYYSFGFEKIKTVCVDEGVFTSTVVVVFRDGRDVRNPDVNKSDAREFVAAFSACMDQDHDVLSQRTKVCPECDELVKYRAKRCKYCGHLFS